MTKAEAKKELGYKPKEKPEEKKRNILQRAKDKLTGRGKKGNLDEVGFASKDEITSMFAKRKAQLDRIDDPARKAAALSGLSSKKKRL